jgi:hypothetical protein
MFQGMRCRGSDEIAAATNGTLGRLFDRTAHSRHRGAMPTRCVRWFGLLMLAVPACGGSSGGATFTPTTPVADACSMLALADVQVLLPGAPAGTALPPDDNADIWTRGCAWQVSPRAVTLLVEGALTSNGNLILGIEVDATSNSTSQAMAVSGVGDKAVYLNNQPLNDQILNARKGSEVVSVAASGYTSAVPESSLQPLAVAALAKL